jgi:epoxyqueuosine reductase
LGFNPVGIASATPALDAEQRLQQWLAQGHAAGMTYLHRAQPRRGHPEDLLPGAKSVLCLAFNYYPGEPSFHSGSQPSGRIARYAVGEDYHRVLKRKLRHLEQWLYRQGGPETRTRSFTDSAPILEREFARRAGLGFMGRNTHLIAPRYGSWVFLAEVVTNLELEPDSPLRSHCGTCTACLEACPTGALSESQGLDARKCISYWTIEHRGEFESAMQDRLQGWLFGCDICQEVCPFNRKARISSEPLFLPGAGAGNRIELEEVLSIDSDASFRDRFAVFSLAPGGPRGPDSQRPGTGGERTRLRIASANSNDSPRGRKQCDQANGERSRGPASGPSVRGGRQ